MKTSDIVKVNITNISPSLPRGSQINPTAAVLFVHKLSQGQSGETDLTWKTEAELDPDQTGYIGDDIIGRITSTFRVNGGLNLIYKRVYVSQNAQDGDIHTALVEAIRGGSGNERLATEIINVQLAWSADVSPSIGGLANALVDDNDPEEDKIIYVTSDATPANLSQVKNIFYHYATPVQGVFINRYESAAAMAYFSKLNYGSDQIKDYEYTEWLGNPEEVNLVDNRPAGDQGQVNIFTTLVGRQVLIGGVMTNGVRLLTYYFEIVLTQKITSQLATLILSKLKFNDQSYATMYNLITLELDVFAQNGLLDQTFVARENRIVFRDEERFILIEAGEQLIHGYKVNVLPPTQADLDARTYTGVFIQLAISNQIRTLNISGLVLGGV